MTMPILPMDLAQELATHAGLIYCAQDQFVVRFSFTGAAATVGRIRHGDHNLLSAV